MSDDAAVEAALAALRVVPVLVPALAELVPAIRVSADARVGTAGIFRSGRLVVCPAWFLALSPGDRAFVAAHELMHLALRTHDRQGAMDARSVNVAHDYIINDMLAAALGVPVPAGGLVLEGARHRSLEELAPEVARVHGQRLLAWGRAPSLPSPGLGDALRRAGLAGRVVAPAAADLDVLDDGTEGDWFPGEPIGAREAAAERVRLAGVRAATLDVLRRSMESAFSRGAEPGQESLLVEALRTAYRPPWQEALQTWMEAVAPGDRSFARASRRGGDRTDVVLPGRRREGWTLHLVLDTSGSMYSEFPRIAGAIQSFCEGARVEQVRLLQCDVVVTRDELVEVSALSSLAIDGLGGSDMSPAMRRLAADPEVEAAVVLTDGYIDYPAEPMPYAVLWVVTSEGFAPPYGRVVPLGPEG